jgi:hypothetical protein
MRIHQVKIVLDKDFFYSGSAVTGRLLVRADEHWGKDGKVFLKFYDKLDIEWSEDEIVTVGVVKRSFSAFRQPYKVNVELFLNGKHVTTNCEGKNDYRFLYPFEFNLPKNLLATVNLKNAKCHYFIKAYLTTDETISKHYLSGVNIFDQFFKTLNHTYCKQEVVVCNPPAPLPGIFEKHMFEARSKHLKVAVRLPKLIYSRGETIKVTCNIDHVDPIDKKHPINLHKIAFKLYQTTKLFAKDPYPKSHIFNTMIMHKSHKHVHEVNSNDVVLEEYIHIPKDIPCSNTRSLANEEIRHRILITYKLSLEFWKNIMVEELDIDIPLLIDPEA